MMRLAISMLLGSVLIATSLVAEQGAPSSQSQVQVFKVCGAKTPAPCATPPHVIKHSDPDISKEARQKHINGTVMLGLIVGADGLPYDIRVARTLGYGLDEEAINAVKKWIFKPSTLDGHPVAVAINVEVTFHL
jgi:TonB family protein